MDIVLGSLLYIRVTDFNFHDEFINLTGYLHSKKILKDQ